MPAPDGHAPGSPAKPPGPSLTTTQAAQPNMSTPQQPAASSQTAGPNQNTGARNPTAPSGTSSGRPNASRTTLPPHMAREPSFTFNHSPQATDSQQMNSSNGNQHSQGEGWRSSTNYYHMIEGGHATFNQSYDNRGVMSYEVPSHQPFPAPADPEVNFTAAAHYANPAGYDVCLPTMPLEEDELDFARTAHRAKQAQMATSTYRRRMNYESTGPDTRQHADFNFDLDLEKFRIPDADQLQDDSCIDPVLLRSSPDDTGVSASDAVPDLLSGGEGPTFGNAYRVEERVMQADVLSPEIDHGEHGSNKRHKHNGLTPNYSNITAEEQSRLSQLNTPAEAVANVGTMQPTISVNSIASVKPALKRKRVATPTTGTPQGSDTASTRSPSLQRQPKARALTPAAGTPRGASAASRRSSNLQQEKKTVAEYADVKFSKQKLKGIPEDEAMELFHSRVALDVLPQADDVVKVKAEPQKWILAIIAAFDQPYLTQALTKDFTLFEDDFLPWQHEHYCATMYAIEKSVSDDLLEACASLVFYTVIKAHEKRGLPQEGKASLSYDLKMTCSKRLETIIDVLAKCTIMRLDVITGKRLNPIVGGPWSEFKRKELNKYDNLKKKLEREDPDRYFELFPNAIRKGKSKGKGKAKVKGKMDVEAADEGSDGDGEGDCEQRLPRSCTSKPWHCFQD